MGEHALPLRAEEAAVHEFVAIVIENKVGSLGNGEGGVSHHGFVSEHVCAPLELYGQLIVRDWEIAVATGVGHLDIRLGHGLTIANEMAGDDLDAVAGKADDAGGAFGFVGFHVNQIAAV